MTQRPRASETLSTSETSRWLHVRFGGPTGTLLTACFGVDCCAPTMLRCKTRSVSLARRRTGTCAKLKYRRTEAASSTAIVERAAASASRFGLLRTTKSFAASYPMSHVVTRRSVGWRWHFRSNPKSCDDESFLIGTICFLKATDFPEEAQKVRSLAPLPGINDARTEALLSEPQLGGTAARLGGRGRDWP